MSMLFAENIWTKCEISCWETGFASRVPAGKILAKIFRDFHANFQRDFGSDFRHFWEPEFCLGSKKPWQSKPSAHPLRPRIAKVQQWKILQQTGVNTVCPYSGGRINICSVGQKGAICVTGLLGQNNNFVFGLIRENVGPHLKCLWRIMYVKSLSFVYFALHVTILIAAS